jgi:hypothetical protein
MKRANNVPSAPRGKFVQDPGLSPLMAVTAAADYIASSEEIQTLLRDIREKIRQDELRAAGKAPK